MNTAKKPIAAFCLAIFICFSFSLPAFAEEGFQPDFEITAESAILINLDSNQVMYQKQADKKMYPASLTKVMTAIVTLENVSNIKDTTYTAREDMFKEFEGENISNAGIVDGEELTVEQLLYALLLQSANEGANVLAEGVAGSQQAFVDKMNEKAKAIGATSTHFANPHGLHHEQQYTTARDMAAILRYAMENDTFRKIASTDSYELVTNKNSPRMMNTTVSMIKKQNNSGYYREYMVAGKTGTLEESGRCFASFATYGNSDYICVVLKSDYLDGYGDLVPGNAAFEDTIEIYGWAFSNFKVISASPTDLPIGEVPVKASLKKNYVRLMPETDFWTVVPIESGKDVIKTEFDLPKSILAPVKAGSKIGTAEFFLQDRSLGSVDLVAEESLSRNWILYLFELFLRGLKSAWFVVFLGLTFFSLTIYIYTTLKMRGKKTSHKIKRSNASKKIRRKKNM